MAARGNAQPRGKEVATKIIHIGKEANKWEQQHFLGEDEEAEIEYGVDRSDVILNAQIRELCQQVGERAAAQKLGISRTALRRALKCGVGGLSRSTRERVKSVLWRSRQAV